MSDLKNEETAKKVAFLLQRDLGFDQIVGNIENLENEVVKTEEEIIEKETEIKRLQKENKRLEEEYPELEKLKSVVNRLESNVKSDIENYEFNKEQIDKLKEEIDLLNQRLPSLPENRSITPSPPPDKITSKKELDFSTALVDEVINIRALKQGIQICVCKKQRPKNKKILLPKKEFNSDFGLSEKGLEMGKEPLTDIERESTKYVATIEPIIIPGKNREFWQELYDSGEFDLWKIDEGPMKYFEGTNENKMFLWILRVYEMPFEIKKENFDTFRGPHGYCKVNEETRKKIQTSFEKSEFSPVLTNDEFERRRDKIREIANR